MRKVILISLLFAALLITACEHDSKPVEPEPPDETIVLDTARLDEAFNYARDNSGIRCLIVSNLDSVIKDYYARENYKTSAHEIMSVTKSVLSILIGIAIDKGIIPSLDVHIDGYIRPIFSSLDSAKGQITLRQLITMSCGLKWAGIPVASDYMPWMNSNDKLAYILNKPLLNEPGTVFNYSDGAAHLLSIVLTRASGMSANNFAYQYLFEPLGMTTKRWNKDNRGFNYGGVQLFLLPQDMIKIGMLMLQKGKFKDNQIVSSAWVDSSKAYQINHNGLLPYTDSYGYYWWRGSAHSFDYYFANGHGGQFIFLIPKLNIIIVATTNWMNFSDEQAGALWYYTLQVIVDGVLASFSIQ